MAVDNYSPRADRKLCSVCGKRPVKTHNRNLCQYCQAKGDTEPHDGTFRTLPKYCGSGREVPE